MDIVRVVNVGDTLHVFKYGGAQYPVAPGEQKTIPVEAAWRSLGNWNRHDRDNDRARAIERERLNSLYGLQGAAWYSQTPVQTAGSLETNAAGIPLISPEDYNPVTTVDGQSQFLHPTLPKIEVYDVETGQRVLTVIDDPDDTIESGIDIKRVEKDRVAMVEAQVQKQAELLDTLVKELAQTDPEKAAEIATRLHSPKPTETPVEDISSADATSSADALDVMNDELGITKPKPRKKAASKKAAAGRGA